MCLRDGLVIRAVACGFFELVAGSLSGFGARAFGEVSASSGDIPCRIREYMVCGDSPSFRASWRMDLPGVILREVLLFWTILVDQRQLAGE